MGHPFAARHALVLDPHKFGSEGELTDVSVCVCVCVCEREREGGRVLLDLRICVDMRRYVIDLRLDYACYMAI